MCGGFVEDRTAAAESCLIYAVDVYPTLAYGAYVHHR